MKRQLGNELYAALGGVAIVAALFIGGAWYLASERKAAFSAGETAADGRWQKRELKQQQDYAAEIERQRAQSDEREAELQRALEKAEAKFLAKKKEHDDEKAKNDRFEHDLRTGRVVLVDPGGSPAGQAGGGNGCASADAKPAGDGAAKAVARGLSAELSEFLWSEAARADSVIEDLEQRLELAQDNVVAYYRMAATCEARTAPSTPP